MLGTDLLRQLARACGDGDREPLVVVMARVKGTRLLNRISE